MVPRYLQEARALRSGLESVMPPVYFGAPTYDEASDQVVQTLHISARGADYAITCIVPGRTLTPLRTSSAPQHPLELYRKIAAAARHAFLGKFHRGAWSVERLPRLVLELTPPDLPALAMAA